jgi:hypothetical protein
VRSANATTYVLWCKGLSVRGHPVSSGSLHATHVAASVTSSAATLVRLMCTTDETSTQDER